MITFLIFLIIFERHALNESLSLHSIHVSDPRRLFKDDAGAGSGRAERTYHHFRVDRIDRSLACAAASVVLRCQCVTTRHARAAKHMRGQLARRIERTSRSTSPSRNDACNYCSRSPVCPSPLVSSNPSSQSPSAAWPLFWLAALPSTDTAKNDSFSARSPLKPSVEAHYFSFFLYFFGRGGGGGVFYEFNRRARDRAATPFRSHARARGESAGPGPSGRAALRPHRLVSARLAPTETRRTEAAHGAGAGEVKRTRMEYAIG